MPDNSTLIPIVTALLGGVLGSVITSLWTGSREKARLASEEARDRQRLESEERRWKTDRLLIREIESLIDLHVALVNCNFYFNTYLLYPKILTGEILHGTLWPLRDTYIRCKAIASIYLTKDERELLNSLLRQYDLALGAMNKGLGTGEPEFDDSTLTELVERAESLIRERLRPSLLGLR